MDIVKESREVEDDMEKNKSSRKKEKEENSRDVTGGPVREIHIRNSHLDLTVLNVLSKTVQDLCGLTILSLWNVGLVDQTVRCLVQCLKLIPSLEKLCLDGNENMNDEELGMFILQPSPLKLKHFSLRHCGLGENSAACLSRALVENTTLLTLNLCFNKIGNEGVKQICKSLRTNKTLVSLDLGSNRISDLG